MSDAGSSSMNYLFYLGIIIPTLITFVLFLVFIYCWFLQKARKEVLTKRYDPHGKMRSLGMSLEPPPPPDYCRIDDSLLPDSGEDNIAYDVSRSPSTEQEARGRPLYQTYHDSGISAGLSPTQENEPRPGLAYRTCPDSGISGFGTTLPVTGGQCAHGDCRGCHQAREQMRQQQQPQQQQQQQLPSHQYNIQVQLHPQPYNPHQQQQQQQQQQQPSPQQYHHHPHVMLHQNLVQASVHPNHGVCYGDDMAHPQSPQHYNPPPINSPPHHLCDRQFNALPHGRAQEQVPCFGQLANPLFYPGSPEHQHHHQQQQQQPQLQQAHYSLEQPQESQTGAGLVHYDRDTDLDNHAHPISTVSSAVALSYPHPSPHASTAPSLNVQTPLPNRAVAPRASGHFQSQPYKSPEEETSKTPASTAPLLAASSTTSPSSSSSSQPQRHSYRDSGVSELGAQATGTGDRPDSQASQSSTTDSEDSGFRSSHCAAHHSAQLSKQANPLLKPLRRARNNKPKPIRPGGLPAHTGDPADNGATPLTTLNPQNLQKQLTDAEAGQVTSLLDAAQLSHTASSRVLQLNPNIANSGYCPPSSPGKTQQTASGSGQGSPVHGNALHSPSRENWPPPLSAPHGQEAPENMQQIDLTDISTHLSWKYLNDVASAGDSTMLQRPCHQVAPEQHMEMFGYSVV